MRTPIDHSPRASLKPLASLGWCVLVLVVLWGLAGCSTPAPVVRSKPAPEVKQGFRFQRADLVDVASFVAERSQSAFVIAQPEWRGLSLSLYSATDVEPERLLAMFSDALRGVGLRMEARDGYWLVLELEASRDRVETGAEGIVLDVVEMPVEKLVALLSETLGKRYLMVDAVASRRLSIKALRPMAAIELHAMLLDALRAQGCEVHEEGENVRLGSCGANR